MRDWPRYHTVPASAPLGGVMEMPDWIVDDVLVGAKPAAFRLVVFLFRHGRQVTDHATGGRRVYWKGSHQSLCRVVGVSRRSLIDAEAELVEAGVLAVHAKTRPNALHAVSLPYDAPKGGAKFAPVLEADCPPHSGGVDHLKERSSFSSVASDTTTTTARSRVVEVMERLGVTRPASTVSRFGAGLCMAALLELDAANGRKRIENPAGYVFQLLVGGRLCADASDVERFARESAHWAFAVPPHLARVPRAAALLEADGTLDWTETLRAIDAELEARTGVQVG